ncbi:MAG: universal stress protein [Acidobacteriota bacterium]|nr:MAG: universal stress protein [Acidobacteriota bacterium]
MMRILIGYDGSSFADEALDDLVWAGLPPAAEVRVVSVDELWGLARIEDESEIAESRPGAFEETRSMAEHACRRLQVHFPAWTINPEVYAGSPARILIRRADEWQVDLLVVGAQGRSAVNRYQPGSVAQEVATEAHCPVRVARSRASHDGPPRIIIGIDGSLNAAASVRVVASRGWPQGTEVKLVTSLLRAPVLTSTHPWRDWYHAGEIQRAARVDLQDAGLAVSCVVEEGDPKRILIEEAAKWNADSVFVGATSLHRVARFLLGSVPAAVITRSGCSVEVIRGVEIGDPARGESGL